jgi:hypothetical protein
MKYAEEIQRVIEGLPGIRSKQPESNACAFKQCDEPLFDRLPQKFNCSPSYFFCRKHLADLTRRIEELNCAAFIEGLEQCGAKLNGQELVITHSCLERHCCVPGCNAEAPGGGQRFELFRMGEFCTCMHHEPAVQYMVDQQMGNRVVLALMRMKQAMNPNRKKLRDAVRNAYRELPNSKNFSEQICVVLQRQRIPIPDAWLNKWPERHSIGLYGWTMAFKDPTAKVTIQKNFSRYTESEQ